ncbi:unnamed protein product [Rangifer tarandus platyrhynchus]|uniref:G-protein coupled receptors family 1 profile domain-containing protein n=1 Tax=Rangifer tarandus platyrhynchus TaxID=3082113 RepID=A0ABN8Y1I7_RANTA|nr:unnamed protein product [Rangifer tarandus platyrhynchus]
MEFVFLAYPSQSEPRALAFLGASLVYTWVITRNVLIMVAIQAEARLHTPMYYFLGSLSGVEIGYTAAVVPHLLANTLRAEKTITLLGCATQMGFFIGLGGADCLLLASMAMNVSMGHVRQESCPQPVRPHGACVSSLTSAPELQALVFVLFLALYLTILCGNTAVIWVLRAHGSLHTPMYFFLCNLSFLEICYSTVAVPLMLSHISGAQNPIPLAGCGAQMFFFVTLGSTDCFLLAIMAYGRSVAIRHPLRYTLIVTRKLCVRMAGLALRLSLQLDTLIFTLPFCGRHFLCGVPRPCGWPARTPACARLRSASWAASR